MRVAARGECPRRVGRQRCLELEGKLAQLKPLKRQFEEYRVQVTDAEAALAECRENLQRVKERAADWKGRIEPSREEPICSSQRLVTCRNDSKHRETSLEVLQSLLG